MLKNDIKSKFVKSLLDNKTTKRRKGSKDLHEKIFPIKNGFYKFLLRSKEEQLEIAKDLFCDLSLSTFASPPNVLMRNLISLQVKERSVNKRDDYFPRDHVIHCLYLYLFGLYLYENSSFFRTKINKKLSLAKRKYSLNNKDNNEIFIELWKHFVLFHDIGYPIERLSNEDIAPFIKKELIRDINNIKDVYVDDYILRIISNIVAIVTVTSRKEKFDFQNQVFQHLCEDEQNELKKYFNPDELEILLKSRPYVHLVSVKLAKMVAVLIGGENLVSVAEDILTGEIVFISTFDRQKVIYISKKSNSSRLYKKFLKEESLSGNYLIKYYNAKSDYSVINALKYKFGDTFFKNIMSVHENISINNLYNKSYHSDNNYSSNFLNYIAYSVITSSKFVDYSSKKRFQEQDPLEIIENSLHDIVGEFPEIIANEIKSDIEDRIKKHKLDIIEIFTTEIQTKVYSKTILSTFQLDKICDNIFKSMKKRLESGTQYTNENLQKFRSDFVKNYAQVVDNNDLYKRLTHNLREIIKPIIDKKLLTSNAISGIFSNLRPKIEEILGKSLEKCKIFNLIASCDFENLDQFRTLFSNAIDSDLLKKVSDDDKKFYKDLVNNYDPEWKIDHGFISSLIYLGNLELLYHLLGDTCVDSKDCADSFLIKLFFNNEEKLNYKSMKNELLLCAEICFRAILLHNFYPNKTEKHKDFSHDLNQNAFTYFSIMCDSFQEWGREIQYDPGVKDVKKFKPDSYYDIQILDNKIKIIIDSDYFKVDDLLRYKSQLSEYLMNINTYIDFKIK